MAGLFLIRADRPDHTDRALSVARAQGAAHGFPAPSAHAWAGWRLLHFPTIAGGPDTLLVEGADLVAVAGTLVFDGLIGRPALAALLREAPLPTLDWSRIGGQFVALVRRGGRTFLFADWFAAFQLFHDAEQRLFSTSFLTAAQALPSVRFDRQGVYEWAFNVVPIGNDTVLAELKTLGPGVVLELGASDVIRHLSPRTFPEAMSDRPEQERLAEHGLLLSEIVGAHVRAFGDDVHCPLSGGLDSRLLLAALRAAGSRPKVYVYGKAGEIDVEIARAIAAAEGFSLDVIDKTTRPLPPDRFAEQVADNFHRFDALPTYGNIFDNGGHAAAQDARHAGGGLAASGGCGEVYRNFFLLPDVPVSADTIARTFFARFMRGDTTAKFEPEVFLSRVAGKIAAAVGTTDPHEAMPRVRAEQVYPAVRCRALFGREISLEARHGAYLMPFLDHRVAAAALTLPMAAKHAGAFEAKLLHTIDPALARHPSAYGHDFSGPPGLHHRFEEWSSRVRPTWLRERSYAIQRWRGSMGDEHGGLLTREYMDRVIDPAFPAMRRYFRVEQIGDSGLWRRIACLEYLAAQLGSRLQQ